MHEPNAFDAQASMMRAIPRRTVTDLDRTETPPKLPITTVRVVGRGRAAVAERLLAGEHELGRATGVVGEGEPHRERAGLRIGVGRLRAAVRPARAVAEVPVELHDRPVGVARGRGIEDRRRLPVEVAAVNEAFGPWSGVTASQNGPFAAVVTVAGDFGLSAPPAPTVNWEIVLLVGEPPAPKLST